MLELIIYSFLNLVLLGRFSGVPLSFLGETDHLLVNQLKTVVNRKILADVVNDEVNSALKDPR